MQVDFVTLLLWFFLASNPNLANDNAWLYSVVLPYKSDRQIHVVIKKTDTPNTFHVRLTAREQEVIVNATRQIDGYKIQYLKPDPNKTDFIPFFPTHLGRTWHDDIVVSSIMHDKYPVWDEDHRIGDVYGVNLQGKDPGSRYTAYTGEKVGLRRLYANGLDYSIIDVFYARSPWDRVEQEEVTRKDPSR